VDLLEKFKKQTVREKTASLTFAAALFASLTVPAVHGILSIGSDEAEMGVGMPFNEAPGSDLPAGLGTVEGLPDPEQLPTPKPIAYSVYKIAKGDTIGDIAERYKLKQDTLLSCNKIKNSRLIQIGQELKIPNQDGIIRTVAKGETIAALAEKYEIEPEGIRIANGLPNGEPAAGETIFLPAARMERIDLQEINGDLFIWPVRGYISSRYGWRTSPFTGARQFHSGLDIAAPLGTPIKAAMAGKVTATGYDVASGNYVVIAHHSGYRTLYGHMDVIRVNPGQYVTTGQRIGDVGSTGLSTGTHVHFTVFKNGATTNPINLIN